MAPDSNVISPSCAISCFAPSVPWAFASVTAHAKTITQIRKMVVYKTSKYFRLNGWLAFRARVGFVPRKPL